MDDFLSITSKSKTRKTEGHFSEDELLHSLLDEEITRQLDNAFTEE